MMEKYGPRVNYGNVIGTWQPDFYELENDLTDFVSNWLAQDWKGYGVILDRIGPLLRMKNKKKSDYYFKMILPLFLDPESSIYPSAWQGDLACAHPFEIIVDALESRRCPPALLALACRSQQNLYRLVAAQNPNCPEEAAVLAALAPEQPWRVYARK